MSDRPAHLTEDGHKSSGEGLGTVGPLDVLVNTDWGALQGGWEWGGRWGRSGVGLDVQ